MCGFMSGFDILFRRLHVQMRTTLESGVTVLHIELLPMQSVLSVTRLLLYVAETTDRH